MNSREAHPSHEVIGRWLNDVSIYAACIELYKQNANLYLRVNSKNAGEYEQEVIEKQAQNGRRFEPVEESDTGDHWIITSDRKLEARDSDGLILTARKLE